MKRVTTKNLTRLGVATGALFIIVSQASLVSAGTVALLWPAGQAGTQAFGGSLGNDFDVNVPIDVTALGVFDHLSDGFSSTLTATIWDVATGLAVPGATATFTSGDPGTLNGSARLKTIPTVTLAPGRYSIASAGHGDPDLDYNRAINTTVDDGGGAITVLELNRFAFDDGFPTNPGTGFFGGGTFEFDAAVVEPEPPAMFDGNLVAYQVNTPQAGNQDFGGSLGMDFVVTSPILVSALGAFDASQDGMNADITVELWSRNDGGSPENPVDDSGIAILASDVFTAANPGTLQGGSRFKSLGSPLELAPGAYTINASGYGAAELLANSGAIFVDRQTNDGGGSLEFVGSSRFCFVAGACTSFPVTPDGGPADRYAAGTFAFSAVVPTTFAVNILNPSFEDEKETLDGNGNSIPIGNDPGDFTLGVVPEWGDNFATPATAGLLHPNSPDAAADGDLVAFMNGGAFMVQDLEFPGGQPLLAVAGETVTISFASRLSLGQEGSIRLDLRGQPNTSVTTPITVNIPASDGYTEFSVTLTISDAAALGVLENEPIFLVFDTSIGGQVWLDSLSGETTMVPEPASCVMLLLGMLAIVGLRHRRRS